MREVLEYEISDIIPEVPAILRNQGVPKDTEPEQRILKLAEQALNIFVELCQPVGVVMDVLIDEFDEIYHGEGQNEPETPVADIFPRAEQLALFALTVGSEVSDKISGLFEVNDFALASMLDAVASEATEMAGIVTESDYLSNLYERKSILRENQVLRYSPGYCGWHISGQKKLFEILEPEEIEITLNDSYLMQPMKSISGVMIVGPPEIHNFAISYKFCDTCETKECRDRIRQLFEKAG